jgi:hypothetical protein
MLNGLVGMLTGSRARQHEVVRGNAATNTTCYLWLLASCLALGRLYAQPLCPSSISAM